MRPSLAWQVFHLITASQGSGHDACGLPQGQVASDHIGGQPPNVGKFFDGAEPQLALRVSVVGLGGKQAQRRTESWWW